MSCGSYGFPGWRNLILSCHALGVNEDLDASRNLEKAHDLVEGCLYSQRLRKLVISYLICQFEDMTALFDTNRDTLRAVMPRNVAMFAPINDP